MRLVSYRSQSGADWGLVIADGVLASRDLFAAPRPSLNDFIALSAQSPEQLAALADRAATVSNPVPLNKLELLPCVPRPGKIICLGVNYVDHAREGGNTVADYPTLFLRSNTSLLAHQAPLCMPRVSDKLDYEAELAVVIGRPTRFVTEGDALSSVFGYACFNDATVRDYQRRTTQWTIGKNFDGTGAFGPWLVTADELPPGCAGLSIQSRLNGQIMQIANTSDMVFGVARTISLLSECLTLEPADVIVMGTPAGVGYARNPPVWMKAGDTIEIEIQGIGVLSNPVTR